MKRALISGAIVLAVAAIAVGVQAKLPKCSSVKCRDLGCPTDVLCTSGAKVVTCAQACGGN